MQTHAAHLRLTCRSTECWHVPLVICGKAACWWFCAHSCNAFPLESGDGALRSRLGNIKSNCNLAALTMHTICVPQRDQARDAEVFKLITVVPIEALFDKVLFSAHKALRRRTHRQLPHSRCIQHYLDLDHAASFCNGLNLQRTPILHHVQTLAIMIFKQHHTLAGAECQTVQVSLCPARTNLTKTNPKP